MLPNPPLLSVAQKQTGTPADVQKFITDEPKHEPNFLKNLVVLIDPKYSAQGVAMDDLKKQLTSAGATVLDAYDSSTWHVVIVKNQHGSLYKRVCSI